MREQARARTSRCTDAYHLERELLPALAKAGIDIRSVRQLPPPQRQWLDNYFEREIYPVLTPLALDPAHPFPVLLNRSLNLAVMLLDPRPARRPHRLAVVQVPRVLPRVIRIPDQDGRRTYVMTADIVQQYLAQLFPGLDVLHHVQLPRHPRQQPRSRRGADHRPDQFDREGADQTPSRRAGAARDRQAPTRRVIERFTKAFGLDTEDVYYCDGPVNLGRLMELYSLIEAPEPKGLADRAAPRRHLDVGRRDSSPTCATATSCCTTRTSRSPRSRTSCGFGPRPARAGDQADDLPRRFQVGR